jgi:hypothetical protein
MVVLPRSKLVENLKNTRSNQDVSDLQVGKSELQKEARVPEYDFQVG